MATSGTRIRLRRTRDGAILYDSVISVENVSEMLLDISSYVGVEGYALEGMSINTSAGNYPLPNSGMRRQTLVILGLHK